MVNAAIIIDGNSIKKWQKEALENVSDLLNIRLILSCSNTSDNRNYIKNFFYYGLNYFTLKNRQTVRVKLDYERVRCIEFDSIYEGNWQKIPATACDELAAAGVDLIIKFGMSLLRIDDNLSGYKIFSFHHGDPAFYRGRPAGFYEVLQKSGSVGTIVQEISNKLDAGKVWAICHSKIYHHSYKKTATNFYANSKYLLRKALVNFKNNTPVELFPNGKNYKLPDNLLVLKFASLLAWRKFQRLLYGAFYEKKWNVATADGIDVSDGKILCLAAAKQASVGVGYNFYADPFFSADGKAIRLEALNSINGLGEILEIDAATLDKTKALLHGGHFSYPYSFKFENEEYLLPEVAAHSSPYIIKTPFDPGAIRILKGLEDFRVVDGSLVEAENTVYLFCGMDGNAADCLYLFFSDGLDKEFFPHPLNPIVVDPARARMGGRILRRNGKLYRYGQNNSFGYGNGISICEIVKLSRTEYEERVTGSLSIDNARGPHTFDVYGSKSVFDYYVDKFSPFAWYRRIAPIILRRIQ